jgi:acid phosphatase family membrane protein YuiD
MFFQTDELFYKLVGTLILNIFIYKYLDAQNRAVIITAKFTIGMCFAVITMCIAGGVEMLRQNRCSTGKLLNQLFANLLQYFRVEYF